MTKPCQVNNISPMPTKICGHIDVISCGIGFPHHADILELIAKADVVFGSRSLLANNSLVTNSPLPLPLQDTRIIAAHAFEDAKTALALCNEGKHVVILTSGDALYHGFGGTLAKLRKGNESICYHPAITAFQALFHRLGMPWNELRLFSAHAGKLLAVRNIATAPFSITYGGTAYPAHALAKALIDFHPALGTRHALIAENLTQHGESLGVNDKHHAFIAKNLAQNDESLGENGKNIAINTEKLVQGTLAELAAQPCGATSILLIIPESYQKYLHKIPHILQENTPCTQAIPERQIEQAEQAKQNSQTKQDTKAKQANFSSQTSQAELANRASQAELANRANQVNLPSQSNLPSQANQAPVLPLGLPEENYERENNLITASDVRAIILARLRLPAWGTLWDIGAGSGSVGLEAAGLCPHLHVIAVEQHPERVALIERNAKHMGVINHTVHTANALELLNGNTRSTALEKQIVLPQPDRIFIGGGGHKLTELLTLCMSHLAPDGLLVASAVTLESYNILSNWSPERRTALSSIQIAHEQSIAGAHHHLKAQNTIYLFTFRKETA